LSKFVKNSANFCLPASKNRTSAVDFGHPIQVLSTKAVAIAQFKLSFNINKLQKVDLYAIVMASILATKSSNQPTQLAFNLLIKVIISTVVNDSSFNNECLIIANHLKGWDAKPLA
jgi:hypothetical protein